MGRKKASGYRYLPSLRREGRLLICLAPVAAVGYVAVCYVTAGFISDFTPFLLFGALFLSGLAMELCIHTSVWLDETGIHFFKGHQTLAYVPWNDIQSSSFYAGDGRYVPSCICLGRGPKAAFCLIEANSDFLTPEAKKQYHANTLLKALSRGRITRSQAEHFQFYIFDCKKPVWRRIEKLWKDACCSSQQRKPVARLRHNACRSLCNRLFFLIRSP